MSLYFNIKAGRNSIISLCYIFLKAEDGIRDSSVTGVQTCALPIFGPDVIILDLVIPNALKDVSAVHFQGIRDNKIKDYHVWPDSRSRRAGSDGKDLGADVDAVRSEERRVGKEHEWP